MSGFCTGIRRPRRFQSVGVEFPPVAAGVAFSAGVFRPPARSESHSPLLGGEWGWYVAGRRVGLDADQAIEPPLSEATDDLVVHLDDTLCRWVR